MSTPPENPRKGFNISRWALEHMALTRYLMVVILLLGGLAYFQLGQDEDPPFTFKVMVVQTYWPGATAEQVSLQVTDRIEKELMSTGNYERIMAYSRPGESLVTFVAKDSLRSAQIPDVWYDVQIGRAHV